MFDIRSRYHLLPQRVFTAPDGTRHLYIARRLLPDLDDVAVVHVEARAEERLDVLAARVLRDPLQYWRICDVNREPDPVQLIDETHRRVAVRGGSR